MPLQKLQIKPGVNRENTRYTNEGGWYECDKVRFRQGQPEKIGGWQRISADTYIGIARSLWSWITLGGLRLTGVGTSEKFYIEKGDEYNDITPLRATESLTDPFETTSGSSIVDVTDAAGGFLDGDYVTFSGATAVGGVTPDGEYQITLTSPTTYSIDVGTNATSSATGGGSVTAAYQINVGAAYAVPQEGWGGGTWGTGVWGTGTVSAAPIRLWTQTNFGEDLIFGPRGEPIYYWVAADGVNTRAVALSSLSGASEVPLQQNFTLVSDISRFVFAFGTNDVLTTVVDPLLIRWSDQENPVQWNPAATNQAGSIRLSRGSQIVSAIQSRQEVLVWTDTALYSLQYVGAPIVWAPQLVGENVSIASQNAVAYAGGIAFWMGRDKFYMYDGRTLPLTCDVRRYIFNDFNTEQYEQVFAGTNEAFHEVWWFYCSAEATDIDRYVVYNYKEGIWYYGTMARTAWLDSPLREQPIAATYVNNIVEHEIGNDCSLGDTAQPINAYISSAQFDIEDGDRFMFIWRVLPDMTFDGSTTGAPAATMTLLPLANSGSGYNDPASVAGTNSAAITRSAVLPVEEFTGQINTRVRGRQLAIRIESTELGVAWQLGTPRIDMRPDGRR